MASKFTPGPWTIEDPMGPDNLWIVEAGKETHEWRCIAMVPCDGEDDSVPKREASANAKLIAASPRTCNALIAAYHALKSYEYGTFSAQLAKQAAAEAQAALIDALGAEVSL